MSELVFLLESFRRNARVNQAVRDALSSTDFDLNDGQGGWTVERHLRHMASFRMGRLWNLSREHAFSPPSPDAQGYRR